MDQKRSEFLALMAAATAVGAIAIDTMLPAFGNVRHHFDLGDNPAAAALIVTVFIAGLGFGQLVYGPLSDRFGRKPIMRLGLAIYIVAGLASTFAPTFGILLVGRFIWGLGSAAPRTMAQAIMRDRFSGDALARAMAVIVTIFLIVPTLAPLLGQLVLNLGSWRYTFAVGPLFAFMVLVWTFRLDETLAEENRRSIAPREIGRSVLIVLRTPSAVGSTVALTFMTGAFLPYLGSSERIFSLIYGRGDEFALWFALNAALMGGFTMTSAWVVKRIGSRLTRRIWLAALMTSAFAYLGIALATGGVPGFFAFYLLTALVLAFETAATPLLTSSALEDVGHVAGTAASLVGAISLIGGSLLSQFIDRAIGDTITPFAVGFVIASVVALTANEWASRAQTQS
ncbi:MAG: multidrug effflux MFS transporter [Actinomycetota bacterium]|nr:multidrug effflux MFS transporter [Actinomycetota bacterium]